VPTDDFSAWPPERVAAAEERVACPGQVGAGVHGRVARQDQPSQHGTERARVQLDARQRSNFLGRRVGLLGGETALLDRERRCVPGCEDVVEV